MTNRSTLHLVENFYSREDRQTLCGLTGDDYNLNRCRTIWFYSRGYYDMYTQHGWQWCEDCMKSPILGMKLLAGMKQE